MATYAIGDVQGCFDQLMRVLDEADYDERRDVLWFVGDIINRGPQSLATLRFVKGLGARQVTVLGNHDLNLLAVAEGTRKPQGGDTVSDILGAPDRDELLAWLRHQKLVHAEGGWAMVHAGLVPQWTIAQALACSAEVEAALQADDYREFLKNMFGNEPRHWRDDLSGYDRLRVIVNATVRMRLATADGAIDFSHKLGARRRRPPATCPGTTFRDGRAAARRIIFGHWAALGLLVRDDVVCLDSGCVWGRSLSMLRLEDGRLSECDCSEMKGRASEE